MSNNFVKFYPQLGANILVGASRYPYTGYPKEITKKGGLDDLNKLETWFAAELANYSVQNAENSRYFVFLAEQSLLYFFYKQHLESFYQTLEIIKHRLTSLKANYNLEFDFEPFGAFLTIIQGAFERLSKVISIEAFEEKYLNKLDWSMIAKEQLGTVSTLVGFVYAQESEQTQSSKSRLWFQKSLQEQAAIDNLANIGYLVDFFLTKGGEDRFDHVNRLIDRVEQAEEKETQAGLKAALAGTALILNAKLLLHDEAENEDELSYLEYFETELRDFELKVGKQTQLSYLYQLELGALIASLYAKLYELAVDDVDKANFSKRANQRMEQVLSQAEKGLDEKGIYAYRLQKANIAIQTKSPQTEKELKDIVAFFKRSNDFDGFLASVRTYIVLLQRNEGGLKSFDLLQEAFKFGSRRHDQGQGGFYLILGTLKLTNDILLTETESPGVSWMVGVLDQLFANITEAIDTLNEEWQTIGKTQVEAFREEFIRFEPISHFNLKVYLLYQLQEVKVMRIGALLNHDKISLQLADRLLEELHDNNNPLSFIKTDWGEFKDVPNSVRNSTLNKCINISKGDLPLAAEHLDFSYRNLRSYITFKEVNRLGFFLDLKQTNNWQLEQGIRLMFYDLYKNGTIFEVVFDMPKFLVEHAQDGFYSSDLEEDLNIKGTTAKKYLKIMIDSDLIRQDKNMGRKHFYRIKRDVIMKRLGKDQATMIEPS